MTRKHTHNRNSLPARVVEFFATNPDEELTYADIVAKFDCRPTAAHRCIERLKAQGVAEAVHIVRAMPGFKSKQGA